MAAHASGPVADNKEAASFGTPADERVKEAGEGAGLRQEFRAGVLSAGGRLPLKWNKQ